MLLLVALLLGSSGQAAHASSDDEAPTVGGHRSLSQASYVDSVADVAEATTAAAIAQLPTDKVRALIIINTRHTFVMYA